MKYILSTFILSMYFYNTFCQEKTFKDDVYEENRLEEYSNEDTPPQLPTIDGKVVYETVKDCELSKDQLYLNAKTWLANTFRSAKDVIQLDDQENGRIIGKGNFDYSPKMGMVGKPSTIRFSIQIDIKDKRYRYRVHDITDDRNDLIKLNENALKEKQTLTKRFAEAQINEINATMDVLLENLENSLCLDDSF